ncbi:cytoplasmic aconitate hydratase-like [Oscarella lobularis]|uniref:cytoplasmic aconitate hydratase-like n=1 Tax=Oscarella lobularis TaxID=121494 RepID=UPI0033139A20
MSPEYGALLAYFPMDRMTMDYFKNTGHFSLGDFVWMEAYLRETHLWKEYGDEESQDPVYSKVVEFDLGTVVATVSGPRKAKDRVSVEKLKAELSACLIKNKELNGFGVLPQDIPKSISFALDKKDFALQHGSVVVAAMSSCTNASNPSVMLGAGLLAKRAIECGLSVPVYIQTSLSPGSSSLTNHYLDKSGVIPFLSQLGFNLSTEKNSRLPLPITESIEKGDIVAVGVLSGNRNFEERVNPLTRANYLASPLLVIAYALAGTVLIDFKDEPLGKNCHGDAVYLKDIWPSRKDIQDVERETVVPALYAEVKARIREGNPMWNSLPSHQEVLYPWEQRSLFLKKSPFFEAKEPCDVLKGVFVLLWLGDSVTSDHISPAGSIPRQSPAGNYLKSRGLSPREFNSYGARRGHCDVMVRGTFSHPKLVNKLTGTLASKTLYVPTGDTMSIHDAAVKYQCESRPLMILAGKDFGGGSARDWAAKGPYALGVRVILAESFDSGYRACVIAMGILPLEYLPGENASALRLSGFEAFEIDSPTRPNEIVTIKVSQGFVEAHVLRFTPLRLRSSTTAVLSAQSP